jgi:methionine synthase I (cobalamin-dependent)
VTPTIADTGISLRSTAEVPDQALGMPVRFLAALDRGPLALDAGMGTRLCARGLDLRRDDPCLWNLDRPEEVLDVHRRDAAAGGRVLFTNTFGANRAWLMRHGRRGDMEPINRAGVGLARLAAGPSGFVAGDIGPSTGDDPGAAGEQAAVLLDSGVDALVFETFRLETALAALREARMRIATRPVPLIASLWQWPDDAEDAARRLLDAGAAVIGLNCRPAIGATASLARRLARAVACPLLIKPGIAASDLECDSTPAAFAAAVPVLVEHNVRLIGGCCGTTEAHVAALASACDRYRCPENGPTKGAAP